MMLHPKARVVLEKIGGFRQKPSGRGGRCPAFVP
jgi:hypothetical protein